MQLIRERQNDTSKKKACGGLRVEKRWETLPASRHSCAWSRGIRSWWSVSATWVSDKNDSSFFVVVEGAGKQRRALDVFYEARQIHLHSTGKRCDRRAPKAEQEGSSRQACIALGYPMLEDCGWFTVSLFFFFYPLRYTSISPLLPSFSFFFLFFFFYPLRYTSISPLLPSISFFFNYFFILFLCCLFNSFMCCLVVHLTLDLCC